MDWKGKDCSFESGPIDEPNFRADLPFTYAFHSVKMLQQQIALSPHLQYGHSFDSTFNKMVKEKRRRCATKTTSSYLKTCWKMMMDKGEE